MGSAVDIRDVAVGIVAEGGRIDSCYLIQPLGTGNIAVRISLSVNLSGQAIADIVIGKVDRPIQPVRAKKTV